jgi:hypothetical protein
VGESGGNGHIGAWLVVGVHGFTVLGQKSQRLSDFTPKLDIFAA